jgi:uncharacterized damage-inducible protein DinB
MTVHPRTAAILDHLDNARRELRAAVDAHPADKLGVAPAPGQWSVLAVLEHMVLVETRLTAMLGQKIAEARAAGIGRETATAAIVPHASESRALDRTKKIVASDAIQPKTIRELPQILAALDETRAALRHVVTSADGLALGEIQFPHPVFGPMDGYGWFRFIGLHEMRHTDQIREIGASFVGRS